MSLKQRSPGLAQTVMESVFVARLYEGRLLRRNPLFALLAGISLNGEIGIIAQAAGLNSTHSLLDLGSGPGTYARALARLTSPRLVVALDLSRAMLVHGKRLVEKESAGDVTLVQADAMHIPFAERQFDVVNCCGALHLFPDLPHVLAEVNRVLRAGGRFTFATFRRRQGRLSERLAVVRRSVTGMNAFRPDELENELHHTGFHHVQCHHNKGIWLIMSAIKAG